MQLGKAAWGLDPSSLRTRRMTSSPSITPNTRCTSCTARQPGLKVLTTSAWLGGTPGSSLTTRCSWTCPVAGSRSMSVSLRSICVLTPLDLCKTMNGHQRKRPGGWCHPGASGEGSARTGGPERKDRQGLVHVYVFVGAVTAQLVLPCGDVVRAAGDFRLPDGGVGLRPATGDK